MNNEDTTGVVKPEIKVQTIAKTKETTRHTMNYKTIHIKLVRDSDGFFFDLLEPPASREKKVVGRQRNHELALCVLFCSS
jgi:hypothetical protein